MKYITIPVLISIAVTHTQLASIPPCEIYLSQTNVDQGTYRIMQEGVYCLTENIIFNPDPGSIKVPNNENNPWFPNNETLFPGSVTNMDGAFALGFFAVIAIESHNVILNLNGFTISYHFHFYLQQRYGSIIEIACAPFIPSVGPADFGQYWINLENITICNGELGLSSHHGIHSNNATNLRIFNLKIYDFEVAAIQLNGFNGAYISNIDIGPSLQNVPLTGYYSNARFLLLALRQLLDRINYYDLELPELSFSYMPESCCVLTLQQIHDNLVEAMNLAFREVIGDRLTNRERRKPAYKKGVPLFLNENGFPDGSALYGILLNSHSVAINGFGDSSNDDEQGENIIIEAVEIHDLVLEVNEVPAMYFDDCEDDDGDVTVNVGPFGDIMDIRMMVNEDQREIIENLDVDESLDLSDLQYIGNPLSDAQIALYLYGDYIGNGTDYSFGSYVSPYLLRWALNDYGKHNNLATCVKFVCNGDVMFHTNKGVVGLRMDGIEDSHIEDVEIRDMVNRSPLVSGTCGNYSGNHDGGISGTRMREGGMSTDIRGISVVDGDVMVYKDNLIEGLESWYGDAVGIDLMDNVIWEYDDGSVFEIDDIEAATKLTQEMYDYLVGINKTPYPNNFEECTVKLDDEAVIIIDGDLYFNQTDCNIPHFASGDSK